jgi:hypothetical protein
VLSSLAVFIASTLRSAANGATDETGAVEAEIGVGGVRDSVARAVSD